MNLVGSSVRGVDGIENVTGRATYTGDLVVSGMVHAKVLRSPFPHARIRNIDATEAAIARSSPWWRFWRGKRVVQ